VTTAASGSQADRRHHEPLLVAFVISRFVGLAEGNDVTYALVLSEDERRRYRLMAETAHTEEAALWSAAGVCAGAAVADIGCGPGAVLRLLAQEVGPGGRADGVDNAPGTVTAGADEVGDLPQATVRRGEATATGLPAGGYDVVMCRHVLAHNGGREADIVRHLTQLGRPGGVVYLVDTDVDTVWMRPEDPDIAELQARYVAYHRDRGNDLNIGRSLGLLLEAAGSTIEHYRVSGPVIRLPPGLRGPAWAAREILRAAGAVTDDDLDRWGAAFARLDACPDRPWAAFPTCIAIGRLPEHPRR
jgi:SAM-dependent methyltransferase